VDYPFFDCWAKCHPENVSMSPTSCPIARAKLWTAAQRFLRSVGGEHEGAVAVAVWSSWCAVRAASGECPAAQLGLSRSPGRAADSRNGPLAPSPGWPNRPTSEAGQAAPVRAVVEQRFGVQHSMSPNATPTVQPCASVLPRSGVPPNGENRDRLLPRFVLVLKRWRPPLQRLTRT
jgi:hypothetical protein